MAQPITPQRFAAALQDLPLSSLALKVFELRNSIAHLDYSNEQLKPFAYPSSSTEPASSTSSGASAAVPDQDCIDAISENEIVIQRMNERLELVKKEVERRGLGWREFMGSAEVEADARREAAATGDVVTNGTNGEETHGHADEENAEERHSAWTDGTFQTGTISGGRAVLDHTRTQGQGRQGGRLGDEELRRRLEERMRVDADAEEEDDGMHL